MYYLVNIIFFLNNFFLPKKNNEKKHVIKSIFECNFIIFYSISRLWVCKNYGFVLFVPKKLNQTKTGVKNNAEKKSRPIRILFPIMNLHGYHYKI